MTKLGGVGCTLVGIGPCLTLFILTIAHSPLKIIILTASGFFWLISLLLTSILWFAFRSIVPHLVPSLMFGVISQEVMRFGFFKLILKADDGLRLIANNTQSFQFKRVPTCASINTTTPYHPVPEADTTHPASLDAPDGATESVSNEASGRLLNHRIVAYVAGLGYGLTSCIFELLHSLIASFGPGVGPIYWESKTFFVISSFEMMCVSLMQIFWSLILFNAFDQRKWAYIPMAYLTHLSVAAMSLLNQYSSPWPEMVCLAYTVTTLLMALMTYSALGGQRLRVRLGRQLGN